MKFYEGFLVNQDAILGLKVSFCLQNMWKLEIFLKKKIDGSVLLANFECFEMADT